MTPDPLLNADARLYAFRNFDSTMPLPAWPSLSRWRQERERIRRHLGLCAGLNAQTAAFKARGRVVEQFEHEGVCVENLCIETLPGLYVVGNLYRPMAARGRLPLILHPHGHFMNSRTTPLELASVPHRAMNSALLGFAAFAYSMIGYDDDTRQIEHRSLLTGPHKQVANTLGLSLFGLQLNNSIKALDYLLARRDIDPHRVGCTGESGGGTQTYFLAAMDERIKVAAPAVMLSGHFHGGCECENAPALRLRYSNLHYAGLIAPRPLLLLGCTGDWSHHLRERELPAMKDLYRLYGREEAVDGFHQDEEHNFNRPSREAVYAWMARWLQNGGRAGANRIPESPKPVPTRSQLLVFDRPVPPYKGAIRNVKQLIATWRDLRGRPGDADDLADVLQLDLPAKKDILIRHQPSRREYRAERNVLKTIVYGRFSTDSCLDCRFLPPAGGVTRSVLVLRDFADEAAWDRFTHPMPANLRRMVDEGVGVLVPRLFGQSGSGEVSAFRERADSRLSTTYVKTEHQYRLDDILTTVRMAQVELKIDPASLTVVAAADMGLLALAAWSFMRSCSDAGPLVADLGGFDLRAPATWVKRAYLPLVLGTGGVAGLARLAGPGGRGRLSGVRGDFRSKMPKGLRVTTARSSIADLLARICGRPSDSGAEQKV